MFRFSSILALLLIIPLFGATSPFSQELLHRLSQQAPQLDKQVLKSAITATECAILNGTEPPATLAIIDFRLPSSDERLWILDLRDGRLVLRDLVAHGRNSGELNASWFSNTVGSLQSSLGLFRGREAYFGKHGYSLRLDGLEPGINDNARDRAIVIHGASYVDPSWLKTRGRIGRSFGCPAVRKEIARDVVDHLKDGQFIFSFYPDRQWLEESYFLNCNGEDLAAGENGI